MHTALPQVAVRCCFISDLHLGSPDARAAELAEFLHQLHTPTLYLVGDVLDLYWMHRRRLRWGRAESAVFDALRRLAQRGTRIIYIPGNHDAPCRRLAGVLLPGLVIRSQHVHRLADGRRLWVTHGDQFDGLIHPGWWLQTLGDGAYRVLMGLERLQRAWARWRGRPMWSMAAWLKAQSSAARRHIQRYQDAICAETRRRGLDGVVCGHIHHPALQTHAGVLYANDGDWVESCSAVVETTEGAVSLLAWRGEGALLLQGEAPLALAH